MDYLPLIQSDLIKVLKSERLIQAVILTDRTGLVILTASKDERAGTHAIGLGALASALFSGMANQGSELLGDLELTISEFADGKIFLIGTGPKAIMAVIAKKQASVSRIRRAMKLYSKSIQQQLATHGPDEERKSKKIAKDRLSQALDLLDF
ncbi:MAG: roadblock/LC7 domain-containing protein [Candidatus Odinarchaeota archaeon]